MDASLFAKYNLAEPFIDKAASRETIWGNFLVFFARELNAEIAKNPYYVKDGKKKKLTPWTKSRVGLKIAHLKVKDDFSRLYTLKSICTQEKARGGSFSKEFNYFLFKNPKPCQEKRKN